MLDFDTIPPIAYTDFLENCQRNMPAVDFDIIKNATLEFDRETSTHNSILKQWAKFNREFRNELARNRAQRVDKDPMDYMQGERSGEPSVIEIASQAVKISNPLEAKKIVDQFRWQRLNQIAQGHILDLSFLIVYAVKLQILEFYKLIQSSKGAEKFEEYKNLVNN